MAPVIAETEPPGQGRRKLTDVGRRLARGVMNDDVSGLAAEIAYRFLFAVFPFGLFGLFFFFLLFRFVLRRDVGSIAIADILLLVLIADASQNAMAGGYTTVAEGCVLVATIAGWNYLLDWASYRFRVVRRLVEAPPLPLVRRHDQSGNLLGSSQLPSRKKRGVVLSTT